MPVDTQPLASLIGGINARPFKIFMSAELTGTGALQDIPHDLGATPVFVAAIPTAILAPFLPNGYSVVEGAHTPLLLRMNVTLGRKFKVIAWVVP